MTSFKRFPAIQHRLNDLLNDLLNLHQFLFRGRNTGQKCTQQERTQQERTQQERTQLWQKRSWQAFLWQTALWQNFSGRWLVKSWQKLSILATIACLFVLFLAPMLSLMLSPMSAQAQSSGQIKVTHRPGRSQIAQRFGSVYQKSRLFETAVAPLNRNFMLPRDLTVELSECGFVNAFYEPARHRVVMCYDLTGYLVRIFRGNGLSSKEADVQALSATVFIFYHELAHMLINELDLPITGKEEDVADQFSSILLSNAGSSGQTAVLAAAQWFGSVQGPQGRIKYMDEHSLNEQRAYYLVCLLYARQPDKFQKLVDRLGFPEERLRKCTAEYRQITRSWEIMMRPYLRK
jgi:Putative metallopeptidase